MAGNTSQASHKNSNAQIEEEEKAFVAKYFSNDKSVRHDGLTPEILQRRRSRMASVAEAK